LVLGEVGESLPQNQSGGSPPIEEAGVWCARREEEKLEKKRLSYHGF